ncbi:MAG: PAS domain-containing protein [Calothrix sp. SM1_7_51]|nr:PAS domain-containing protein [Calothrix sp. SM1_7_51]
MNADQYATRINNTCRRTYILQKQTGQLSMSDKKILEIALQDLCIVLEELRLLHQELDSQNQQLLAARQQVERECDYYRNLFNFAPDGYLITDIDGKIIEANLTAARLLNVEQEFFKLLNI